MEVIGNLRGGIEAEVRMQLKPINCYQNSGHSELRGYLKGHCFARKYWVMPGTGISSIGFHNKTSKR